MADESKGAVVPATQRPPAQEKHALAKAGTRGIHFADMGEMWRFCVAVVNSKQFKDIETPDVALMRLQAGLELGLTPIWALANIMVLNGRPSVWGDALLGIVRAHPEFEDIIETLEGEGDAMVATCEVKRRGQTPTVRRFSVVDAKKANLWGKAGPWQTYPKRMLQMRPRGFACRDAFADALRGFGIIEELRDIDPPDKPISATVLPPMQLPGQAEAEPAPVPAESPVGSEISGEAREAKDEQDSRGGQKSRRKTPPAEPAEKPAAATEKRDADGNFIWGEEGGKNEQASPGNG